MIETIEPTTLATPRLKLRPHVAEDAADIQRLINDAEVSTGLCSVPYPYPDGLAAEWLSGVPGRCAKREALNFAITLRDTGAFIGNVGLHFRLPHDRAEFGYWLGKTYWGQGYCTEALRVLIPYGFDVLKLNRLEAYHFSRNTASGRVLQKAGMRYEGHHRQMFRKSDAYEDAELYAIVRSDLEAKARSIDPRDPWIA